MQPNLLPKVDTQLYKDDQSRLYGVRSILIAGKQTRTIWLPGKGSHLPLNQGSSGESIGYSWAAQLEVLGMPSSNRLARDIAWGARWVDVRRGRHFHEGATLLGGAQYAKTQGYISGYRWCFGIEDLIDTLCFKGPVVLALPWYTGMFSTDTTGRVWVNGEPWGVHSLMAIGYWPHHPHIEQNVFVVLNAFGFTWGVPMQNHGGIGFITESDMRRLLVREQGEACIADDVTPTQRLSRYRRMINWRL